MNQPPKLETENVGRVALTADVRPQPGQRCKIIDDDGTEIIATFSTRFPPKGCFMFEHEALSYRDWKPEN